MERFFVVYSPCEIKVGTLYFGCQKKKSYTWSRQFHPGVALEVLDRGIFVAEGVGAVEVGWYVSVRENQSETLCMLFADLQERLHEGNVRSAAGLELERLLLRRKLNLALDSRDEASFYRLAEEYNRLTGICCGDGPDGTLPSIQQGLGYAL